MKTNKKEPGKFSLKILFYLFILFILYLLLTTTGY